MRKPDDIPQNVWDSASRFMERAYPCGAKEFVSRAIMAAKAEEREACELIAQDWTGGAEYIAAAIRKRGA